MVTAEKITANTSFFMMALILQKLLSFIYFTFLARNLGVEVTGQYFFAISFATMFAVLMDLGLSPLLIREVAKERENSDIWFRQIFTLKIIFSFLTAVLVLILNQLLFADDSVHVLIYLTLTISIIDSFTLFFYAFIRGRQSLKFESLGTIIFQFIVMILGLTLMRFSNQAWVFILVLMTASLFNFFYSIIILSNKFKIKLRLYYSKNLVKNILLVSLPFSLAAIFTKVYAYIDTFFLKLFLGDTAVGFYSVAYKITFALQFIPMAFVAALYPAFTNYFKNNSQSLSETFSKAWQYLVFISLPIALGIMALADHIVGRLYTNQFGFSIWPLQVLIASIPFLFSNFSFSSLLNATDRAHINTRNIGIVMCANIVANLIFIPSLGIWGASLSSSLSTLLLFSLNLIGVFKVVSLPKSFWWPIIVSIFSSIIMLVVVLFLKNLMNWLLVIPVAGLIYVVLMFLFKALRPADWLFIKRSFLKSS